MEKLRKISLVVTILMLLGCIFINKSYATINCNVSLSTQNSEITKGEEITIYANISNVQVTKGIIAIGAVIEYDKNSLTLLSLTGENGWSNPFYNEENGKITAVKNNFATKDETILKMTFKVNESAGNSAWVKVNNFQVSDGDEEIDVGGSSATISIKDKNIQNPEPPVNPGDNTNNNQNQGTNKPNTGNNRPSNKPNGGSNIPNNNTTDTNTVDETNTNNITNENMNENTNEKRNIDALINYPVVDNTKNTSTESSSGKGVIYAICIIGAILVVVIMVSIVKSSADNKE